MASKIKKNGSHGEQLPQSAPALVTQETSIDWAPSVLLEEEEFTNSHAEVPHSHQQESGEVTSSQANFEYVTVKQEPTCSDIDTKDELTLDTKDITNGNSVFVKCEERVSDDLAGSMDEGDPFKLGDSGSESTISVFEEPSSEPSRTSASGVSCSDAELLILRKEQADLKKEVADLKEEQANLKKAYCKLRNQLTETEVDKFELTNSLTEVTQAFEKHKEENEEKDKRIKILEEELRVSKVKIRRTENKLEKIVRFALTEDLLQNNNFVKFYTGLPSHSVFQIVLDYVSAHVTETRNVCLNRWQSCLLTLMRLRLSLSLQDLAFRFGISVSTASRTFERWLHYLYACLNPLLDWPDRDTLFSTSPDCFKEAFVKNVAIITDCLEVFTDRPVTSDQGANNKHPNTVKFLLGITPCGTLSFVSDALIGTGTDKHLTLNCGVLENLLPNDAVLANSGLTEGADGDFDCARVNMSAKGQTQLSPHVFSDNHVKHVLKSNVEKVTGLLKKRYHIFKSLLPSSILSTVPGHDRNQLEEMVRVCCALINLSETVV